MKFVYAIGPLAIGAALVLAGAAFAESKSEEAQEKSIQLSDVPQPARDAAEKKLGTAPSEAKLVAGTNPQQYELEGKTKAGKEMGVHVLADGTIVKTESGHEDHD